MDYEKLLKKARKEMPEVVFQKERFEIPKVRGHIQGNRTIVSNFSQIAAVLRRPVEHFLKYILKELATPGELKAKAVIFNSKLSAKRINEKIKQYSHEFVLCSDCGKPDTKIIKEGGFSYLKCLACGAKKTVKSKI